MRWVVLTIAAFVLSPALAADGLPERCVKCHTEAVLVDRAAKIPQDRRKAMIEAFLAKHYTPDAAERAAIAAALSAMARGR